MSHIARTAQELLFSMKFSFFRNVGIVETRPFLGNVPLMGGGGRWEEVIKKGIFGLDFVGRRGKKKTLPMQSDT